MKINEQKPSILRILKRTGKIGIIPNKLNIPEINKYKFLGIMLNQSIRPKTHEQYIKDKVKYLNRRICFLRPSLASMKTRLALYKIIVLPLLTYAFKAIYNNLK